MRQEPRDTDKVITYGSSAYWINLLAEDITPLTVTKH